MDINDALDQLINCAQEHVYDLECDERIARINRSRIRRTREAIKTIEKVQPLLTTMTEVLDKLNRR